MSAHVLLKLLNEFGKGAKCKACRSFYLFFATSLINSIIQEHKCYILHIYHMSLESHRSFISDVKTS